MCPGIPAIGAVIDPAGVNRGSHPAVLMPGDVGDVFLAGLVVNQADDECPHDPTPLFDRTNG
jgi:hypothetical protein